MGLLFGKYMVLGTQVYEYDNQLLIWKILSFRALWADSIFYAKIALPCLQVNNIQASISVPVEIEQLKNTKIII